MELAARLDRLHAGMRRAVPLQRFTLLTRGLLALGFVAPGTTKLLGMHFAPGIDPATPMGVFFDAFHATGLFYAWVGGVQVSAALLLLFRRTALLGACLYLAVISSIFLLVTATGFGLGTPVVTGLMTLACLWLLAWDAHRLAPLLSRRAVPAERAEEPAAWDLWAPGLGPAGPPRGGAVSALVRGGWLLAFGGALALTLSSRGLGPGGVLPELLVLVVAGVLLTLGAWVSHAVGWQATGG